MWNEVSFLVAVNSFPHIAEQTCNNLYMYLIAFKITYIM
jgi:hypothetical protein